VRKLVAQLPTHIGHVGQREIAEAHLVTWSTMVIPSRIARCPNRCRVRCPCACSAWSHGGETCGTRHRHGSTSPVHA
jgi:hypothetical protein